MALDRSTDPLVWIDCEMTGLNPKTESILSIACFVTNHNLDLLDRHGFEAVIRHDKSRLDEMDAWCTKTHGENGLTAAAIASKTTPDEAANALLKYITHLVPSSRTALLAGNSVHADKAFLSKAPYDRILQHLHYRILDVSSLKEAARRWCPSDILKTAPKKRGTHMAREDILDSIEEAAFYKGLFEEMTVIKQKRQ